jgi:formate dehydrogenase subunit delta
MSSYDGKLVMMANQIGKFYAPQKQIEPVAAITTHIRKFWDPHMRAAIVAHLQAGGADLDPMVREAIQRLTDSKAT